MYTTLQTQRPDGRDGRGHLRLAYLLRICLLCKGPEQDSGLLLRSETLLLNTHKDDSRCSESALWQGSDRMTLLPGAGKQPFFPL